VEEGGCGYTSCWNLGGSTSAYCVNCMNCVLSYTGCSYTIAMHIRTFPAHPLPFNESSPKRRPRVLGRVAWHHLRAARCMPRQGQGRRWIVYLLFFPCLACENHPHPMFVRQNHRIRQSPARAEDGERRGEERRGEGAKGDIASSEIMKSSMACSRALGRTHDLFRHNGQAAYSSPLHQGKRRGWEDAWSEGLLDHLDA